MFCDNTDADAKGITLARLLYGEEQSGYYDSALHADSPEFVLFKKKKYIYCYLRWRSYSNEIRETITDR